MTAVTLAERQAERDARTRTQATIERLYGGLRVGVQVKPGWKPNRRSANRRSASTTP